MTRFTSRLSAGALVLAVGLTLTACSSGAASSAAPSGSSAGSGQSAATKALRIGFIPPTMAVPAFQGLAKGLEGAGAQYGDTVVTAESNFDPTKQLQTIQQWVELGQIDALWVIPVAAPSLTAAIQAAQAKGIVVIAGGLPADYGLTSGQAGVTFSNVDNAKYGEGIGQLMADCVKERAGGKADVIYMANTSVQSGGGLINDNALSTFADLSPDSTISQQLDAKDDRASDQTVIQTALLANPEIDGLFTGDAESTMAAVNAFTNANADLSKVCIVGNGGTDEQTAAIKAGSLFGVVSFDFNGDLEQNLTELHTLAADPTAPGRELTTPISLIRN